MQTTIRDKSTEPRLRLLFDLTNLEECELLHKLRAVFQEHSDIAAFSERYFVVFVAFSENRRLTA